MGNGSINTAFVHRKQSSRGGRQQRANGPLGGEEKEGTEPSLRLEYQNGD